MRRAIPQGLILNYAVASTGSADESAQYNWLRKQFAKLGIQLNIEATLYNRFQDKVQSGSVQIFAWGWLADYPDPENFLFLLYGPNSRVRFGGENATNYSNAQADKLFTEIAVLPNSTQRQQLINQFLQIVREDSPWLWGFNPIDFTVSNAWVDPYKANALASNTLKYLRINGKLRADLRQKWNQPVIWPLWIFLALFLLLLIPLVITSWQRENRPDVRRYHPPVPRHPST